MADEADEAGKECPCSWMDKAKAICLVIGALTTAIASIAGAVFGALNHTKAEQVLTGQAIAEEKTSEVKGALDTRSDKVDKALGKIEKTTAKTEATVVETLGPQLYSTWKYLSEVADFDPTAENKAKAKEAKEAFEKYTKKKP